MRAIRRQRSLLSPRPLSVFHPCFIRGLARPCPTKPSSAAQLRARNPLPGQHLRRVAGAKRSGAPVSATWGFATLRPPATRRPARRHYPPWSRFDTIPNSNQQLSPRRSVAEFNGVLFFMVARRGITRYSVCTCVMCNHETVLSNHVQHYENSCAASGMELILKLHSLVCPSFRDFQDKYGDTNIGFEKLADMAPYGIRAEQHEMPIKDGFGTIQREVQRGHYPILSLYSEPVGWHIWVAIPDGDSFCLVSRAYGYDEPLQVDDLNTVRRILIQYRNGKIHFVTYDADEPHAR